MAALFCLMRLLGAPSSPQRDRAPGWRGTEPGARRDGRLGCQICSQVCGLQPLAIWPQPRSRSPSGSGRSQGGLLHPRVALAAVTASLAACEGKDCDALEPPRPARRALATFPASLANSLVSTFCFKFCPQGQQRAGRARVPTTGRCSSSSTSRRCATGSASARSSAVRCCCRARRRLPARC